MARPNVLTTEQVAEIKKRIEMGIKQTRIAKDFGVCYKTLWNYVNADKNNTKEKGEN